MDEPDAPVSDRSGAAPPSVSSGLDTRLSVFNREGLAPIVFSVLFVGCGAALLYVLGEFITDLVMAFILVGLFGRTYRRLVRLLGGRRWLASSVVTSLVLVVILVPLASLVYTVAQDAARAYQSAASDLAASSAIEGIGQKLQAVLGRWGIEVSPEYLPTMVLDAIQGIRGTAVAWGSALVGNTLAALVHFAVILVLVFYLLVDGERFRVFAFELSPLPDDEDAMIIETFRKVARGVVVGNGLGSAIQGVLGGIAVAVVGVPSPALWGSVMAVAAFLPLVGIALVVVPVTLLLMWRAQYWEAVLFFGFCTAQGLVVENVVKTKLMGSQMRMHDLLVFLSILGGVGAFGVSGLVYGPLIAMLFMTLNTLYRERYWPQLARRYASSHPATIGPRRSRPR